MGVKPVNVLNVFAHNKSALARTSFDGIYQTKNQLKQIKNNFSFIIRFCKLQCAKYMIKECENLLKFCIISEKFISIDFLGSVSF